MKKIFSLFKNQKTLKMLVSLAAILMVTGVIFFVLRGQKRIMVDNSTINAPIVSLTPMTAGKLKTVLVNDGDKVKKGDAVAQVGTEMVRAFTDGIVINTDQQIGSMVSPQVPVVQIVNPNQFRVNGIIDENKGLNQVKVGQAVSFTVDAIPDKKFWGYVDEIAQTAKQTQISFSISNERPVQQFDIYAKFDATNYPEIKNGMSAKMTVFTQN